jgi:hypothetical protein
VFSIRGKLSTPVFDLVKYRAALEKAAREVLSRAMFEYVITVQNIVPVWSGASHATLTQLAGLVGMPLAIQPSATAFNGVGYGQSRGDAKLVSANGEYGFTFETTLPHLIYNEYNNANTNPDPGLKSQLLNPGPYHFQRATKEAVTIILRDFELPDLKISRKRVR